MERKGFIVWEMALLSNPLARYGGHLPEPYRFIVGFTSGTKQVLTDRPFPISAHAFAGVASPALAVGISGKNLQADAGQILFVYPRLARAHDNGAIIQKETMFIRVPEKIKSHH